MIGLLCFVLAILASPFKSKVRLEAENAVLRHQLIVLKRRLRGPTPQPGLCSLKLAVQTLPIVRTGSDVVRFASGISFDQYTRNLCNNYATNLRDRTLAPCAEIQSLRFS